ncbi:MAG: NFACT RNA binding domain-containing protein [Deltaproteobacteria bacterium]|nr:NFACT RNA binding domain-containing protein [Deltaproteobacteria bacterium]
MTSTTQPELVPAKVQKATVTGDACVLEVFGGAKRFLIFEPGRFAVVDDKPLREEGPPAALQGQVRKELVPSILSAVDDDRRRFLFVRKDAPSRVVVIEPDGKDPRWLLLALTDEGERILATSPATRATDGRDLRRGRLYELPRTKAEPMTTTTAAPTTTTAKPAGDPVLQGLKVRLKGEIDRKRRLLKALQGDQTKHGDPALLEEQGELLKTVMGKLKRGAASVDVVGYDGTPRVIGLDPTRDPKQNLALLFGKAKKARTAIARTAPRIEEASREFAALEAARALLIGDDDDAVARVESLLAGGGPSPRRKAAMQTAQQGGRVAWRSFAVDVPRGTPLVVRVGRGAKDNDVLVKSAKGHDLWLHARDATGGHVIVPSDGGDVDDAVLRDAALLAAWFSSLRGERHVDIQHTRVKNLRKPGGGAAPGLFLVSHETVLGLRVDDERIKLLLAAEVAAQAPKLAARR